MVDLVQELTALVQAFEQQGIPYALCGGIALAVHGAPRATQDIDLMARREDMDRIRVVANDCGFLFESLPMTFSSSGITIQRFTKLIEQRPLMLDVLFAEGPLASVWETRSSFPWQGGSLQVISREGPISLKLAAGRPQDIADIQRLREVHRG